MIRQPIASVDSLVGAVAALSPRELGLFLDAMAGQERVAEVGWRVSERRLSAERFPKRNQAIRSARRRGLSYAQLGKLFGMSRYAIRNIVAREKEV